MFIFILGIIVILDICIQFVINVFVLLFECYNIDVIPHPGDFDPSLSMRTWVYSPSGEMKPSTTDTQPVVGYG